VSDNPRPEYAGVVTVPQFISYIRSRERDVDVIARCPFSKSTFYDIIKDPKRSRFETIEDLCNACGVDLVVGIRKKP